MKNSLIAKSIILGTLTFVVGAHSQDIKMNHTVTGEDVFSEAPKQKSVDSTYNRSVENCANDLAHLIACPRLKNGKISQTSSDRWGRVHYLKSSLDQCREDLLDLRPQEGKSFTRGDSKMYLGNRVEEILKNRLTEDQRKILFSHDQLGTLLNNFEQGVQERLNDNLSDPKNLEANTKKSKKAPLTELLSEGSYQKRWSSFWNEYATKKDQDFYKDFKSENCEKSNFAKYEKGRDGKRDMNLAAKPEEVKPEVNREIPSVDTPLKDVQKDVKKLGSEYQSGTVSAKDTVEAMDQYQKVFDEKIGGVKLSKVDPKDLTQVRESKAFVDEVLRISKGNDALLPYQQRRQFEVASLKLKTMEKKAESVDLRKSMVSSTQTLTQVNEKSDLASDQKTLNQIHDVYTRMTEVKFNPPQTRVVYTDYKNPFEVRQKLKFVTELKNVNSWALKKAQDAGNKELADLYSKRAEEYEKIYNQLNNNPYGKN